MCGGDCERAGFPQDVLDEYVRAAAREGRPAPGVGLYRTLVQDAEANRARALPKLRVPVLALGGETGVATLPAEQPRRVAEDGTTEVVPGVGHRVVEQRPDEVARRVERFLVG